MKNKILIFVKVPPPVTGATLMNEYVANSKLLNDNYITKFIKISYNDSLKQMGKWRFKKVVLILFYYKELVKSLVLFKPDLVYFQISPIGLGFMRDFFFVLLIKLFNVKIVFHIHGKGIKKAASNAFRKKLYRFAFRNTITICLSNSLTYDIDTVFNGKIFIVPNGIAILNINKYQVKTKSVVNIIYLSNLIVSKGIVDFVKAIGVIKQKGIKINAYINGKEGDLTSQELREFLVSNNVNDVINYLGPRYGEDKNMILRNSDILVFPTYYENETFGLVNIEAMQFGMPVISTNEGAISEIIDDGETGFLVEKKSPKQIAEKLELLINNERLRIKMGNAARKKFLEKYTIEIFEQNINQVFNTILNNEK